MAVSKAQKQGYLLIDHTASPGVSGLPPLFEAGTITCNHCNAQVLRDPGANHEKYWCWGCDHYLCKRCKTLSAVAGCQPFDAVIEKFDRQAHKGLIFNV